MTLALATIGLGLNLRASVLLGPQLRERSEVTPSGYAVLIGLPLLIAALVRLPVGVLTDRYGARVMFPGVSLAAAVSLVVLALAGPLPVTVLAGGAAGVGSAAFVVGSALVTRTRPYGRRGRALGLFGLGVAVAAVLSILSGGFDLPGRADALLLAGALVAFAGLTAVALRDPAPAQRADSPLRTGLAILRLATTSPVSLLYLLALGGIVSIAAFLPVYLYAAFGFTWFRASAVTVVVVALAAAARLAGGWRTDHRPTARLLTVCYGAAAALCLVAAAAPGWRLAVPAIAGTAVCDGLASGALLALIGKAARPDSAGAVLGVTGAAGAFGALLPPLLFAGLPAAVAWSVLAVVLLAASSYVHLHGLSVGLGLAVEFRPEPSPTTLTVAVLGESATRWGAAAVVARLAELAASDELVVVFGSDARRRPFLTAPDLVAGLRDRLPRHSVVSVAVGGQPAHLSRDALLLSEHIEAGTLAVAVTPVADLREVAADLALYLQADRLLTVSFTPADGAELQPA